MVRNPAQWNARGIPEESIPMPRYLVLFEPTPTGFSAHVPDLPGCIATGATHEEVERTMREAMEFHLDGLPEEGEFIPVPRSTAAMMEGGCVRKR